MKGGGWGCTEPLPVPGLCATRPAELTPWSSCVLQNEVHPIAPPTKWDPSRPLEDTPGLHSPGTWMVFALDLGSGGSLGQRRMWTHLSGDPSTSPTLSSPSLPPSRWRRPHPRSRSKGNEQGVPWPTVCQCLPLGPPACRVAQ